MSTVTLKAGARIKSAVCDTQIMVIKAAAGDYALHCGGAPMLAMADSPPDGATLNPAQSDGTLMGKRYVNADESIEMLCTKPGAGSLSLDGTALAVKQAKQLPSSD